MESHLEYHQNTGPIVPRMEQIELILLVCRVHTPKNQTKGGGVRVEDEVLHENALRKPLAL